MFKQPLWRVLALLAPLSAGAVEQNNAFNPAVSLILSGTYREMQYDPTRPATGFAMNPHPGHTQGLAIGESELGISANIDPDFRGTATLALGSDANTFSVENAYIQTLSLSDGFNLKFGRFFSGLGYLNEQHAHAWDFVDQPLAYASLWNNQLGEDGLQLKWLAPTDLFIELGGEVGRGRGAPGTDTAKNGSGMQSVFVHLGDDIGIEQSWRAGLSLHRTKRTDAKSENIPDLLGGEVKDSFTGDSQTAGLDLVWKYSPAGNIKERYWKLQAEYFQRHESGLLTYDTDSTKSTDYFAVTQRGWYLQSIYQFKPRWRIGVRYDQLDPGIAEVGTINANKVISRYDYLPTRTTLMSDYSPSEFSRFRLQIARDATRKDAPENQIFLQYIMSLGAHGAHRY